MFLLPCLLLTAMVTGSTASDVSESAPAGATPVFALGAATFGDAQGSSSSGGPSTPHLVAFGATVGAGDLGTGFVLRYWFARYVGLDTRLNFSRAEAPNQITGYGGFSFEAAPSVIVMVTQPDASRAFDVRPYFGAGVNHTRAGSNIASSTVSGNGSQIFGGVETQIRAAGALAISGEVVYNRRPSALVAAGVKSGFTGDVSFIFYVK
jgi:hypothetical protein